MSAAGAQPQQPAATAASSSSSAEAAIAAGRVAFVTLTNGGYLDYSANCLITLDIVGEPVPLTVYCADSGSYERVRAQLTSTAGGTAAAGAASDVDARVVPLHEEDLGSFLAWKQKGWARLMWLKCEVMRRALMSHEFVIFTDGDIVYERPGAVAYCVERLLRHETHGGLELLMQDDGLGDNDGWGLCAGFMAARATPATRAAFTVDPAGLTPAWDDQRHLNALRDKLRVQALPLPLFPNGQYWARHKASLRAAHQQHAPFLVHYNWVEGGAKRERMREDRRWYVRRESAARSES